MLVPPFYLIQNASTEYRQRRNYQLAYSLQSPGERKKDSIGYWLQTLKRKDPYIAVARKIDSKRRQRGKESPNSEQAGCQGNRAVRQRRVLRGGVGADVSPGAPTRPDAETPRSPTVSLGLHTHTLSPAATTTHTCASNRP
ncbi:hypothetical protein AALO_G00031500 [Alosa alosa]|uniref:Uncharacterized protein n=1 Tax=Alosa alosa TaxID=278164 RepID=A0AAV6HCH6_9TELE|nr:hypothetical protein AALO_G00031500 [Alosa alosa]